ncbi:MAG TPA: ABC transporter permease [Chloroflexota bacterium]|nr:ABC transporter permease [Chloroflexota bacterium]
MSATSDAPGLVLQGTTTRAARPGAGAVVGFVGENAVLMGRWFSRLRREPIGLITTLAQPVLWLILFGHLFSGMASGALVPGVTYLTFMTAGSVVMTVYNASINSGVEVLFDRESGFLQRLMVAPINRLSLVVSRFLYILLIGSAQSLLILAVAYALGVRIASGLGGIAMILVIGMLLGIGLVGISMILAFSLKRHGDFFTLIGFIGLPLVFLSSALAPISIMPPWMRLLARFNPMTYAIDATRSLVINGWDWLLVIEMVGVLLVFDAVTLVLSANVLRRELS